ncbi:hypothetical protein CYMTET_13777 [Cymbomonas tetramitiformis]|uniref:Uncharacterized protein n=1 Tax=Cymbomonas tetramitiformis TaxID=36881 RepID=A0AAE0LAV4_9CHLO|nr:hypothetical protein CYMTET_13777 [Cymbomonas tetramitiformis]
MATSARFQSLQTVRPVLSRQGCNGPAVRVAPVAKGLPSLRVRAARLTTVAKAQKVESETSEKVQVAATFAALAALTEVSPALAAQSLADVADARPTAILFVLGPAVAWVAFNILGPALNQLDDMDAKNTKGLAAGLGLSALLAAPGAAEAAQQVAQVADARPTAILFVLGPAVAWVAFNILGPALNQLDDMDAKNTKGLAAGLGLSALLAAPGAAEAAQQVAQVADARPTAILFVLGPAVAWVAFNILGPALNQLDDMDAKNTKGLAAGLGLSALLAAPGAAEAAQQVAQVADARPTALLFVLGPAVAWVAFNILGPALNQLDDMSEKNQK